MNKKTVIRKLLIVCIWLAIWQIASELTGLELIMASPVSVLKEFVTLLGTSVFYRTVFHSFIKITLGFLIAFIVGILFAVLSNAFIWIRDMMSPLVYLMKALPVASFIILILIWCGSTNISVIISFIVVFPMIYIATLEGFSNLDSRLSEMADVFRIRPLKRIRYVYAPQIFPYIVSNCKIALGMCWKAGISAEVIGLPSRSIGAQMYLSKLYLMTAQLMAWSMAIIIVSVIFEKLFLRILYIIKTRLEA